MAGALLFSPPDPGESDAFSPLVTSQSVPSGPVVIRGSVHGTPGEIFCTLTLDHVVGAACAAAVGTTNPAMARSAIQKRRAALMSTPSSRAGILRIGAGVS